MEEIKTMLQSLVNVALKAKNEAKEEEKEEVEEVAENEEVDKRDIIRQIMAIAGKEEASEDVKTIAKLAEKLAYDKSEAGTADNCGKKGKNEEDKEEEKEDKKEAKNKCKNEDKEEKEVKYEDFKKDIEEVAENKKAKNSLDALKEIFFEGEVKNAPKYISQKDGIELGKKLY